MVSIIVGVVIVIQTQVLLDEPLSLGQRARCQNDSVPTLLRLLVNYLTLLQLLACRVSLADLMVMIWIVGLVLVLLLLMLMGRNVVSVLAATVDLCARTVDPSVEIVLVVMRWLLNWRLIHQSMGR